MELLFSPGVRSLVKLIHVSAGLFWLGWIVFIFTLLIPVLRRVIPDRVREVMPRLKQRIRKVVLGIIALIVLTGLYNMAYRDLFRWEVLEGTGYGRLFLVKLTAAALLFFVYFIAPYATGARRSETCSVREPAASWIGAVLHVIAFASGMTAAYIGIHLGG